MALKPVLFRMPEELIARLDQHVARELAKKPGYKITRSDVVRNFLEVMLQREEAEQTKDPLDSSDDDEEPVTEEDLIYWGLSSASKKEPSPAKKKPARTRRSRVKK